ncbi:proline-rich protein 4-like [Miscanthus floridulus]|uniref:proline-rich protein 4-like n=1 Tax=Miscanthus floridulus TaxID=154761 RepID=UPI003459A636
MASRRMLLGVCAVLMAVAVANAAEGQVASVVVGLARCADCTRKNMKAEAAFKGLQVAIKCKNTNGEYETKAVSELQSTGAFSVPLAADLHGADCHAQLHSATNAPCPGQEPSIIAPMSGGTFVAIPGKTHYPSAECASAFLCSPIKKHFLDHFHKAPVPEHKPKPVPVYHPTPEYHPPTPEYHPPTPVYGQPKPTPIYHPPAEH